jgi:ribonuclease P protein component
MKIFKMKMLRIKKRRDFVDIQQNNDCEIRGKNVVILCKRTNDRYVKVTDRKRLHDFVRIGVVSTKKIDKRAVVRNRIKRMIREVVRNQLGKGGDVFYKNHTDYEIIAKKSILNSDYKKLYDEVESLLTRRKDGK